MLATLWTQEVPGENWRLTVLRRRAKRILAGKGTKTTITTKKARPLSLLHSTCAALYSFIGPLPDHGTCGLALGGVRVGNLERPPGLATKAAALIVLKSITNLADARPSARGSPVLVFLYVCYTPTLKEAFFSSSTKF